MENTKNEIKEKLKGGRRKVKRNGIIVKRNGKGERKKLKRNSRGEDESEEDRSF